MNKPYPLYTPPTVIDLKQMIKRRASETPDDIAFSYPERKNIAAKSCAEFNNNVDALGTYIYSLGLKNSHIAIIGENSYEWLVVFFAITNGGNVAVPIDKDLPPEEISLLVCQSDCKAVFVSAEYSDKAEKITNADIIPMKDFADYINTGADLSVNDTSFISYEIDVDKLAAIFFTSGTTGHNKGVMLSQKNIISDINYASKSFLLSGSSIALLPFHHTFGLITAVFKVFNYGYSSYINKSLKNIQRDLKQAEPQTTFLVPLFVETLYKQIWSTAKKNNKDKLLQRMMKISDILLKIGIDKRRSFFKSVHEVFGGKLEYIICGGAYLDEKYIRDFESWGIRILNGYGITECSPVVSVNRNFYQKSGSVGMIIDGEQVRIATDCEIQVKGDNVMLGYYKDDAATQAVISDGWFSTGDLGHIKDNFIFITGRKKNLIILSNGENVSAEVLEEKIYKLPYIKETIVYGKENQIVAEVYLDEEIKDAAEKINDDIQKINRQLSSSYIISKVIIRDTEFPKTTTKKIKRGVNTNA